MKKLLFLRRIEFCQNRPEIIGKGGFKHHSFAAFRVSEFEPKRMQKLPVQPEFLRFIAVNGIADHRMSEICTLI